MTTYTSQNWHQGSHTNLSISDIGGLRAMDDALTSGTLGVANLTITDPVAETALTVSDNINIDQTAMDRVLFASTTTNPPNGNFNVQRNVITGRGITDFTDRATALKLFAHDHTSVADQTITNMSRSSSTLTVTVSNHGFSSGDRVVIYNVTSTFNVSPNMTGFAVSNVTTNTFDITVAGLSSGSYTSGGTVTNRPMLYALQLGVVGRVARGGLTGTVANADDLVGAALQNEGLTKATDGFYVAASPAITDQAWFAAFNTDTYADYGLRIGGKMYTAAIDTSPATYNSSSIPALLLPNAQPVSGKSSGGVTTQLFLYNSSDQLAFVTTMKWSDSANVVLGTSTGSFLGAAANQKLSFHGVTPVVQHSTTGTSTGFTAGGGTTVTHTSTFTGNSGSTAYTIGDVVKALKDKGLMAV